MPTRSDVYTAIDSERNYQAKKWGEKPHEVAAFITYIQDYVTEATRQASRSDDVNQTLITIRKIAGLAVACMEQHGAPFRFSF